MSYRAVFRPGLFAGKSIIITGGGSGIGRCTAHELVSLGARVALIGRSLGKLQAVQAELRAGHASPTTRVGSTPSRSRPFRSRAGKPWSRAT